MKKVGIIEGFYGKSYEFSSRYELIKSMSTSELNYYLYAPKEDPFIRNNFDLTPSESWQNELKNFIAEARNYDIDVGVGLTPYKEEHIKKFEKKIESLVILGCNNISLLFDDLEIFDLDKQLYLYGLAKKEFPEITFDFCPSVYCNELIEKDLQHNEYFEKFLQKFPSDGTFYWTGNKVISTNFSEESEDKLVGLNSDHMLLWDNYFTIDSCPKKINLTNFKHLDKNYIAEKNCYFVNMTGMMRTDQLIIALLANLKTGDKEFEEILLEHGLNEDLINMIYLFDPDTRVNLSEKDKKKLHDIMYTWFHPIKNEWYPYLHNLKNWG